MLFVDIEANNLLRDATKIWCIVAYDDVTNTLHIYATDDYSEPANSKRYNNIEDMLYLLDAAPCLCSFNGIMFDLPLLNKLHGFKYDLHKQVDLCLDSRLQYPDRDGHSLSFFGQLLGFPKGEHNDWSKFSQEMLDYCIQDVMVTEKTSHYLKEEAGDWDWIESKRLEYKIADIQMRQEMKGVLFDSAKAIMLSAKISTELATIEEEVLKRIPLKAVQQGTTVSKPFLKNGKLSKQCDEWKIDKTDYKLERIVR